VSDSGATGNLELAREKAEFSVCEESGIQAARGACPQHGGDACLIQVVYKGRLLSEAAKHSEAVERLEGEVDKLKRQNEKLRAKVPKKKPRHKPPGEARSWRKKRSDAGSEARRKP
jgi:hypothetical protein